MKESTRLNQEDNKRKADERAAADLALLQKPVGELTGFDLDRMPADVYKARLADPAFVEFVNK